MRVASDRLEFAPPPAPGLVRALGLAVVVHIFLVAALTWGVSWKRDAVTITAEAELWSAMPQEAAAPLMEMPSPEPVVAPVPMETPLPPPPPPVQEAVVVPDADIALAQEKLRLKKEQKLALEQQRLETLKEKKLQQEKREQEKLLLEKKRLKEERLQDKLDQEKAAADAKKKAALDVKKKEILKAQQEAKSLEAQREANLKRMAGLAGATGSQGATGTALQSSGPSAGYGGRIRARIKPNIVFTEDIVGNPTAEVEVRTSLDGTIISRKLTKASGVKAWDDAVLRAIDKTEILPRDVDGRVPPSLVISFRPKD